MDKGIRVIGMLPCGGLRQSPLRSGSHAWLSCKSLTCLHGASRIVVVFKISVIGIRVLITVFVLLVIRGR